MKVIITGASRGIGLFLFNKMSEEGHDVYGTYNSTEPPSSIKNKLSKIDITDTGQVSRWIDSVVSPDDDLVLINAAGSNYNAMAHKADVNEWKKLIDVNLIGTFGMINKLLPYMREKGFGRVVNFSSVVAQKAVPGTSAYAASKAALWGMTRAIASENAKKNITVNNLNLGYFDIGMISDVPDEILENIKKSIPVKKLGNPENIYNAVEFLVNSDYITGSSIDVNGGLF